MIRDGEKISEWGSHPTPRPHTTRSWLGCARCPRARTCTAMRLSARAWVDSRTCSIRTLNRHLLCESAFRARFESVVATCVAAVAACVAAAARSRCALTSAFKGERLSHCVCSTRASARISRSGPFSSSATRRAACAMRERLPLPQGLVGPSRGWRSAAFFAPPTTSRFRYCARLLSGGGDAIWPTPGSFARTFAMSLTGRPRCLAAFDSN